MGWPCRALQTFLPCAQAQGPRPGTDMELGFPFTVMFLSREEVLGMKTTALSSQSRKKVGHRTKTSPPWKPVQPLATAARQDAVSCRGQVQRDPGEQVPLPVSEARARARGAQTRRRWRGKWGWTQLCGGRPSVPRNRIAPSTGLASAAACPGCACAGPTHAPESWWGAGPRPGHRDSGAGRGLGQSGPWLRAFPSWSQSRVHAGGYQ